VVPEGKQRRYAPDGPARQVEAAGARELGHELLGAEFTQIVAGAAGVIGGVGLPGQGVDFGGQIRPR
jgi:hypothetical protein